MRDTYGNVGFTALISASGHATMPLLAGNRKDSGVQIGPSAPQNAVSMAVSWPAPGQLIARRRTNFGKWAL